MARGTYQGTKHKAMSYTKFGYIFIAPFVIVYCLFSLYPLLTTFWYSGANMKSTTADFWGFSDKEVYYDEYLDLSKYYDDLESSVGIPQQDYMKIRNFFSAQSAADQYDPLNAEGVQALINNGEISQATRDQLQQSLDNNDISYLSDDAYNELKTWKGGFSDLELTITNQLGSLNTKLTGIVSPEESGEEDETAVEITAEDILNGDSYAEFIATLEAGEFDDGQILLINYLTEKSGADSLAAYFSDESVSVDDPMFYYICSNLNSPKAKDAEGENINSISVPFMTDLETYLTKNTWPSVISSLNSYSSLEGYSDGSKDLHDGEETLYADLETLANMGLITNNIQLVADGDTLVPESDANNNVLYAMREFIDSNYQSDDVKIASAMQIGKMVSYLDTMGRAVLKGQGVEIDKYITFSGDFDVSKYKAFKAEIGLADVLTMAKYEEMDEAFKQKNVEAAQAVLAEYEPQLAPAEQALAAAEASGDADAIKEANENLATVRNKISRAQSDIKTPAGLLTNVNSKYSYLFVGFDNFASIFNNKTRRDTVFGSFVTTAVMWIIGFIPQVVLSLLLSAWFTDTKLHLKGLNLMKALMYLPNVITAVTVAIFFRKIFSYSSGGSVPVSQMILRFFGDEDGYNFFESAWATRLIVCFVNFWMWYGNTMIILIAGITSISVSLYESAQIDGANSVQTYFRITLPLLRPILLFLLVTSLIGGLQMYDIPMNINMNPALINFNGTMIRSTRTVLMYVNQQAFGMQDVKQVGIASSVSIILFIVTTVLSICIFYLLRDKDAAKAAKEKRLARKAGAGR